MMRETGMSDTRFEEILAQLTKLRQGFLEIGEKPLDHNIKGENSWCRRSESNRHGVEAPRDFESIPDHQAISHHF